MADHSSRVVIPSVVCLEYSHESSIKRWPRYSKAVAS
jgi:hypothetical protein